MFFYEDLLHKHCTFASVNIKRSFVMKSKTQYPTIRRLLFNRLTSPALFSSIIIAEKTPRLNNDGIMHDNTSTQPKITQIHNPNNYECAERRQMQGDNEGRKKRAQKLSSSSLTSQGLVFSNQHLTSASS